MAEAIELDFPIINLDKILTNVSNTIIETEEKDKEGKPIIEYRLDKVKMSIVKERLRLCGRIEPLNHRSFLRVGPIETHMNEYLGNDAPKMNEIIQNNTKREAAADEKDKKENEALISLNYIFDFDGEGNMHPNGFKKVLQLLNKKDEKGNILFEVPKIYREKSPTTSIDNLVEKLEIINKKLPGYHLDKSDGDFFKKMIRYLKGEPEPKMFSSLMGSGGGKKSRKRCNKSKRKNKNKKTRKAKPKRKSRKNSRS